MGNYHGIFGYSDDNWLLAPSLAALQDMLRTCEEYAGNHNLKFSTDPNPTKCKTKLMGFLKKARELPSLLLCGNPLPWVDRLKHLGNNISNVIDGNQLDMKIKAAKYVDKNNSLCQEFYFAHPSTKVHLNNVYNGHFTGSQLWQFGSKEMEKFESTYNRSVKIMYDLPWGTHRFFIEPLTSKPHLRRILVKRYLSFIEKINSSKKRALKALLELVKTDVRTNTGSNLRWIMLMAGMNKILDLTEAGTDIIEYHKVPESQTWKINFLKEIIDVQQGELEVPGMVKDELDQILDYICTQ